MRALLADDSGFLVLFVVDAVVSAITLLVMWVMSLEKRVPCSGCGRLAPPEWIICHRCGSPVSPAEPESDEATE